MRFADLVRVGDNVRNNSGTYFTVIRINSKTITLRHDISGMLHRVSKFVFNALYIAG